MIIHADESSKRVAGESWHSDVSCEQEPPLGSILRIHTLPETGGDTLFASMYAAYDALSEPMKALPRRPHADPRRRTLLPQRQRAHRPRRRRAHLPAAPSTRSIRTHPVTGRKALFVNEMFTTQIDGLSTRRERCAARLPVRAHQAAAVPVPLPLAEELDRVLGQPLRAAPGDLGLLAGDSLRLSRHRQGRQARLMTNFTFSGDDGPDENEPYADYEDDDPNNPATPTTTSRLRPVRLGPPGRHEAVVPAALVHDDDRDSAGAEPGPAARHPGRLGGFSALQLSALSSREYRYYGRSRQLRHGGAIDLASPNPRDNCVKPRKARDAGWNLAQTVNSCVSIL